MLDQIDEALENKKVREIAWPMMVVKKGQTCWIPYGTLALACGSDDISTCAVIPWVNSTMHGAARKRGEAADFFADALTKYLKKKRRQARPGSFRPSCECVLRCSQVSSFAWRCAAKRSDALKDREGTHKYKSHLTITNRFVMWGLFKTDLNIQCLT